MKHQQHYLLRSSVRVSMAPLSATAVWLSWLPWHNTLSALTQFTSTCSRSESNKLTRGSIPPEGHHNIINILACNAGSTGCRRQEVQTPLSPPHSLGIHTSLLFHGIPCTTRKQCITIFYHAIENTEAKTILHFGRNKLAAHHGKVG